MGGENFEETSMSPKEENEWSAVDLQETKLRERGKEIDRSENAKEQKHYFSILV